MYTYRDLIRKYSADVMSGHADRDLSPRKRRLTAVLLNLASNTGWADVPYPPTPETRDLACQYLGKIVWDGGAGALVRATSPAAADDFSISLDLALTILRNV